MPILKSPFVANIYQLSDTEKRRLDEIAAGAPYEPERLAEIRSGLPPHLRARLSWLDWDEEESKREVEAWRLLRERE